MMATPNARGRVTDPVSGSTTLLEEFARKAAVSRRALLQRGLALGLAAPALGRFTAGPVAAGRAQTPEKGGQGTLIVTIGGDPLSFNPDFQVDDNGWAPSCNIYNTMVTLDADYAILPELAQSWQVADDGLSITFNLVQGATWHDGQPVTSADCKYTIDQIIATPSAPAQPLLSAISAVEAPDDATVIFRLKQPSASLLSFLGWYGTNILPAHIYRDTDWATNPANQQPIGSGPFRFVGYEAGATIELEANLDYWGEGPYVDRLVFSIIPDANTAQQALLGGEADVVYSPSPARSQIATLQETPGIEVVVAPIPSAYYIGCHMEKEPTSNVEVRRAISQAINRQQILDTALGGYGEVATTFYTRGIEWAANFDPEAQVPQYDRAAAEAALDAAGYPATDGTRFRLVFPYFTASPEFADIATVVKQNLGDVGIEVELVALEIGAWGERMQAGDFDIGLIAGLQGPDPDNLKIRVGTGGGVNHWRYANPEVDALLNEGGALTDQAARAEKYHQVQLILARDIPIIPLAEVVLFYPHSERVSGLYFSDAKGRIGLNRFTLTQIED